MQVGVPRNEPAGDPTIWSGHRYDALAGLYDVGGGAHLDPLLGRFLSDQGGANGYVYAGNSPTSDYGSIHDLQNTNQSERVAALQAGDTDRALDAYTNWWTRFAGEQYRDLLEDEFLASQSSVWGDLGIAAAGPIGGVLAAYAAIPVAAGLGLGALGTTVFVAGAGGAGEYLAIYGTAEALDTTDTVEFQPGTLAVYTGGAAISGGIFHGAGLAVNALASSVARSLAGTSGALQQRVYTSIPGPAHQKRAVCSTVSR